MYSTVPDAVIIGTDFGCIDNSEHFLQAVVLSSNPEGLSTLGHWQGEWSEAERSPSEGCLPSSFIQHGRGIIIMDFCSPRRAAARLREQKGTKTFPQTCCPSSDL